MYVHTTIYDYYSIRQPKKFQLELLKSIKQLQASQNASDKLAMPHGKKITMPRAKLLFTKDKNLGAQ
ncbi:MAG: hypothetical protein CBB87_01095 [Micavibrio sp. TMED27]|nr:hypothetical protein [Micavibrio sp.]OUT92367.1 MAG: hypothetical protein CBB87_01095 [Micavibrio sp. TMED27]|tara:strand:+ start:1921 stop:2121 length:201 start_codon:yes stop_codon:yes gene_type:complete